jgi:hypothetical protein
LISPWAAVFEIAPANVEHGAVREHGFTSSPAQETQGLVAISPPETPARASVRAHWSSVVGAPASCA